MADQEQSEFSAVSAARHVDWTVFSCLPVPVAVLDKQGRFIFANRLLNEMLGIDTQDPEAAVTVWSVFSSPSEQELLRKVFSRTSGPAFQILNQTTSGRGGDTVVEWRFSPCTIDPDNHDLILLVGQDHTAVAEMEQRIAEQAQEQQRAEREARFFTRLGANLAGADTLEKAGMIARFATEELWAWDSFLFTVQRSGRAWFETIVRVDTIDGSKQLLPGQRFESDPYLSRANLGKGEPLLINRSSPDEEPRLVRFGDKQRASLSLMFAPITAGGEVIGIMSVQSYRRDFFAEYDCELLRRIASAVGQSVKRCQAESRSKALASLGHKLSAVTNAKEAAQIVLEAADELIGWDAAFLSLYNEQADRTDMVLEYDLVKGERRDAVREDLDRGPTPMMRKAIMDGPQLVLRDRFSVPDFPLQPFGDEYRPSMSLMFVPIRSTPHTIGVLSIQSYTARAYDSDNLEMLQALADQCSGALERAKAEGALRESEARFRMVAETLGEGLIITDKEDVVLFANERMTQLSGYKRNEMMGKRAYELFSPLEDWPQFHARVVNRIQGTADNYETLLQRKDGSLYWAEVFGSPFRTAAGEIIGTLCAITDIEDRKRAQHEQEVFSRLGLNLAGADTAEAVAEFARLAADQMWRWDSFFLAVRFPGENRFRTVLEIDSVDGQKERFLTRQFQISQLDETHPVYTGRPLLTNRPDQDLGTRFISFGSTGRKSASMVHAPVRVGDAVVGIISIQSYKPGHYRQRDCEILQRMADTVGPALERCRTEEALHESEERYRVLIENINDGIAITQAGRFVYVNHRLETMLGYEPGELYWFHFDDLFASKGMSILRERGEKQAREDGITSRYEATLKTRAGSHIEVEIGVRYLKNYGGSIAAFSLIRDISQRKVFEKQLQHGSFHDTLTGLPNRALISEHISRAVSFVEREVDYRYAVLMIDLDRFKIINESLGHIYGDMVLKAVSARLSECVRSRDILSRIGGDEFAVFLDDIESPEAAFELAHKILTRMREPFLLEGREIFSGLSIGIAVGRQGYTSPEEVLRDADIAMYRAKMHGRSRYEVFEEAMRASAVSLLNLENDLRRALDRGEFVIHFQPIILMHNGEIAGFEALVRWNHPERGLVYPIEFIPLAEETGLIVPLGWWVLSEACKALRSWQSASNACDDITMSVNISPRQFREPDFIARIVSLLEETQINPRCLKLEITETTMMENAESTSSMLLELRALDIQLNIDDFGTGHSSLSYLHRFPIDALKVDRSFVSNMAHDENPEIIRSIVMLAHSLGMDTIAEGVETAEQLAQVVELGCRFGQGFHFSHAVDSAAAANMMKQPLE